MLAYGVIVVLLIACAWQIAWARSHPQKRTVSVFMAISMIGLAFVQVMAVRERGAAEREIASIRKAADDVAEGDRNGRILTPQEQQERTLRLNALEQRIKALKP